jgi:L-ascorbate oxidase
VVDCPPGGASSLPLCVRDLVMMPSARAEIWVEYRDANGAVVAPPPGATATLKQDSPKLGPRAEEWPQLKLAKVEFAQPWSAKSAVDVIGDATNALAPENVSSVPRDRPAEAPAVTVCRPLAHGHRRRIFFGMVDPSNSKSPFGLGYEETVHKDGDDPEDEAVVPGTLVPVSAFDPAAKPLVCLPLGPGGAKVHETWELVNLATETHNFHIHQTRFSVLGAKMQMPQSTSGTAVIEEDNIPVPFALATPDIGNSQNGYCMIDQWGTGHGKASQSGQRKCLSSAVVLDIPFSQLGEFVFHCHILEHEDGGMMAKIKVVAGEM